MKTYKLLSERLGERWPRLMPLQFAAAYIGMIDVPKFVKLCETNGIEIKNFNGDRVVDRETLDQKLELLTA